MYNTAGWHDIKTKYLDVEKKESLAHTICLIKFTGIPVIP